MPSTLAIQSALEQLHRHGEGNRFGIYTGEGSTKLAPLAPPEDRTAAFFLMTDGLDLTWGLGYYNEALVDDSDDAQPPTIKPEVTEALSQLGEVPVLDDDTQRFVDVARRSTARRLSRLGLHVLGGVIVVSRTGEQCTSEIFLSASMALEVDSMARARRKRNLYGYTPYDPERYRLARLEAAGRPVEDAKKDDTAPSSREGHITALQELKVRMAGAVILSSLSRESSLAEEIAGTLGLVESVFYVRTPSPKAKSRPAPTPVTEADSQPRLKLVA